MTNRQKTTYFTKNQKKIILNNQQIKVFCFGYFQKVKINFILCNTSKSTCFDLHYYRTNIHHPYYANDDQYISQYQKLMAFYTLEFKFTFTDDDIITFAYAEPYPLSRALQLRDHKTIGHTQLNNPIIQIKRGKAKQYVVILARYMQKLIFYYFLKIQHFVNFKNIYEIRQEYLDYNILVKLVDHLQLKNQLIQQTHLNIVILYIQWQIQMEYSQVIVDVIYMELIQIENGSIHNSHQNQKFI